MESAKGEERIGPSQEGDIVWIDNWTSDVIKGHGWPMALKSIAASYPRLKCRHLLRYISEHVLVYKGRQTGSSGGWNVGTRQGFRKNAYKHNKELESGLQIDSDRDPTRQKL